MQRFATDHIGAGMVPGTWPPAVGRGPCPRVSPSTGPCSALAMWRQAWGRAGHHRGSKLHFLVGAKALVRMAHGSPGTACMHHAWLLRVGGQRPQPSGPQATRQAEGRSQGPRPPLCLGAAMSCVLCWEAEPWPGRRSPTRGYCGRWGGGSRCLGGCQCGAARLRQRQVGWEGWGEAGRLWHPRGTGTPVS